MRSGTESCMEYGPEWPELVQAIISLLTYNKWGGGMVAGERLIIKRGEQNEREEIIGKEYRGNNCTRYWVKRPENESF